MKRWRFHVHRNPEGLMFTVSFGRTAGDWWIGLDFWKWTSVLYRSQHDLYEELTW